MNITKNRVIEIENMRKQKEKLRKQYHSPLQKKRIKYLGVYLPKETKTYT